MSRKKIIWIFKHPIQFMMFCISIISMFCAAFILWTGYLLFGPDPCRNWRPSMTDEEKILMVLKDTNYYNSLVFEITKPETGEVRRGFGRQVPYKNYKQILEEQPDCCHVYSSRTALTDNPQPVDKTRRGDEGTVVLRYEGKYIKNQTKTVHEAPVFQYLNLNTCRK